MHPLKKLRRERTRPRGLCWLCQRSLATTRDHVLPRAYGTIPHMLARNIRFACESCNQRRGRFWHCPAVLACVNAVQEATGETDAELVARLRMKYSKAFR